MKRETIGICPICNDELHVTRLTCHNCNTSIEGDFELCKFSKLSKDQKSFLETFVVNRGNIKEIEKDLGISYPTVKNKLEDLIKSLGHNPNFEEDAIDKQEILDQLDRGEITSKEALKILKNK
nr:DUF2089 domain-containing protein [Tissierella sp.]